MNFNLKSPYLSKKRIGNAHNKNGNLVNPLRNILRVYFSIDLFAFTDKKWKA